MIRGARRADLPALSALWEEAFGEPRREALALLEGRGMLPHMLVHEAEGRPVAMLTALPAQLACGHRDLQARYLFAVATARPFRGRGIAGTLIRTAHARMERAGVAASVLVPGQPRLFDYYARFGYRVFFPIGRRSVAAEEISPPAGDTGSGPLDAGRFFSLREAAFGGFFPFVRWDREALGFLLKSVKAQGGAALSLRKGSARGYALCERRGEGVRVTELAPGGLTEAEALSLVHARFGAPRYEVLAPADDRPGYETRAFGMLCPLTELPTAPGGVPYLNFAKD